MKYTLLLLFQLLLSNLSYAQTQVLGPIDVLDQYFKNLSEQSTSLKSLFTPNASISSITYDSLGQTNQKKYSSASFIEALNETAEFYRFIQEPVVLINRSYGYATNIYTSVYLKFIARNGSDSIESKSIQSFSLVYIDSNWLIDHINIQNEIPNLNFNEQLWPEDLTKHLKTLKVHNADSAVYSFYDPAKVYNVIEVDEAPLYPGNSEKLEKLMVKYGITLSEDFSPFLIKIDEEGGASEYYLNDLSGSQLASAKAFIAEMIAWYPAIKDGASVKCKLKYYIK